ncbi:hypothetical protein O9H85_32895 [Paenibacillus filicis]|uniref:YtzI protein n=1 Tax=Paenibacillus gyeongsangnamensis TaxID=3388067 RepID=A0ABT4QJL3_9BACL|nr:hypothetical protein [Paenibacillus filicis]MCZ8517066.1 hypothetical protein [Paenibacillus filicis]
MMMQELEKYALAALIIGTMLILCIDVVRRNEQIVHSLHPSDAENEETFAMQEEPLVYPLYVDCSQDLSKSFSTQNPPEIKSPGHQASA